MSCRSCNTSAQKLGRSWLEDDDADDDGVDRDSRTMEHARRKATTRENMVPAAAGHQGNTWGGGMRRMVANEIVPSREDAARYVTLPGRYVPIGFHKYKSPVLDPSEYRFYRVADWSVAVPRSIPGLRVRDLLYRIYNYGPDSAGYVRIGDTLVPAELSPGDRMTLAGNQLSNHIDPLSP